LRDLIEARNFSNTVASRRSNQLIRTLDDIDNIKKFYMTKISSITIFTEPKHFIREFSLVENNRMKF